MIKRFLSIKPKRDISCFDCKYFVTENSLCRLNSKLAYINRQNPDICGPNANIFDAKKTIIPSCTNCKMYNNKTFLCKLNEKLPIDNRNNKYICGPEGKNFNPLNKTNLVKSEDYLVLTATSIGIFSLNTIHFVLSPTIPQLYLIFINGIAIYCFSYLSVIYNNLYIKDNEVKI